MTTEQAERMMTEARNLWVQAHRAPTVDARLANRAIVLANRANLAIAKNRCDRNR